MAYKPTWDYGNWIADCDVCGRTYKASQLLQRWDGLMCCPDDWEIRHPQDFVRGVPDNMSVPWSRPESSDSFIFICTRQTSSCFAGMAAADCAQADQTWNTTYEDLLSSMCYVDNMTALPDVGVAGCCISGYGLMGR